MGSKLSAQEFVVFNSVSPIQYKKNLSQISKRFFILRRDTVPLSFLKRLTISCCFYIRTPIIRVNSFHNPANKENKFGREQERYPKFQTEGDSL